MNQEKIWPDASQNRYRHILEQADVIHYVSRKSYKPAFMLQRNKYMIEKSSLVIAVFDGSQGGTKYTLDYALKRGIPIVQINLRTFEIIRYNE